MNLRWVVRKEPALSVHNRETGEEWVIKAASEERVLQMWVETDELEAYYEGSVRHLRRKMGWVDVPVEAEE